MEGTSRYWRREARNGNLIATTPSDDIVVPVKGRFFQGLPGTYKHVTVAPDGTITILPKAFADDVVAFVAGAIASNPNIDDATKAKLREFVDLMDARAVARHGYSANPDEAAVKWDE
jgi:hypothetical protein